MTDPRKLRKSAAVRSLNSTDLGTVCDARRVADLAQAGGWMIGDGKTINLLALTAYLAHMRHTAPEPAPDVDDARREAARERRRRHERKVSAAAAEVGPIPECAHPVRRRACGESLHLFLATYFPDSTGLGLFSADHVRVIDRIEECLRHGGRFVNAVYRGFAKTTITENAALWAALYGVRRFVAIVGATKPLAKQLIASISRELSDNDLLAEDFPEVCLPFRHLEGKSQRAASQTQCGQRTHIAMTGDTIVLPTIRLEEGQATHSSGCIIRAAGIEGAGRGLKFKRADGANSRPDFALLDDIQTPRSARSPLQVQRRLDLIRKDVLKGAGHRKTIACVINATVLAHDDVVDQLLDAERNPSWQGERVKMVRQWSEAHETLWQDYAKIRRDFARDIPGDQQRAMGRATAFYRANRAAMDAGCVVSWHECYDPEPEISAIQHAYNLWFDDPPEVFASECQNEPAVELPAGLEPLNAITVARKVNGLSRRELHVESEHLTAAVDVHADVLYWLVAAWKPDCSGWVVDYGTWPEQRVSYFAKRQATRTLGRRYPGVGPEGALVAGLGDVVAHLCNQRWTRSDGAELHLAKILIDGSWSPDQVEHVCRTSPHASLLQMSKGVGIGAGKCPISEYPKKTGRTLGDHWYIESRGSRPRLLHPDTNYWKTWLHGRLAEPATSPGAITLWGRGDHLDHRLLADHLVAEKPQQVTSDTHRRTVIEWQLPPGRDNHWLDCLVYCAVAANLLGCRLGATAGETPKPTRRSRALAAAKARGLL